MVTRITRLTDEQRARMEGWADKWIEVGLRTGPADRETFEAAAKRFYEYAGVAWPGVVVWVPSPMVLAVAAPTALYLCRSSAVDAATRAATRDAVRAATRDAVDAAVRAAVGGAVDAAVGGAVDAAARAVVDAAVGGAVGGAVDAAVRAATRAATRDAVDAAVRDAVDAAVRAVVDGAVRAATRDAVDAAVHAVVDGAVRHAASHDNALWEFVRANWYHYLGGQFWVGDWYWGPANLSFFREVCALELPGDLWDRAIAYQETTESACWWYPTTEFVMVSERPTVINQELVDPERPRGGRSHRLHCDDGPAIAWPDGWGIWAIHGTRVPRHVIEAPETITAAEIQAEPNAEVRRVMLDRFGAARYIREIGATEVDRDRDMYGAPRVLYRVGMDGDEPLVMVHVINSTPEPDGSYHEYWLRVDPRCQTAREAIASTCRWPDGSRVFAFNEEPVIAS